MKSYINSQFKHPSGFCGSLVGFAMANIYKERLDWTVENLDVQASDQLLEIGFGPGVAIQKISAIATNGFIAGIDPSRVMVRQARHRNRKAIRIGQVELHRGSVHTLPFDDEHFDKVFTINSFHHWPQPQEPNLKEIIRVLKPGGRILIAEQPHWVPNESEALEIAETYKNELTHSGFTNIETKSKAIEPGLCFIVIGEKQTPPKS